MRNIILTTLISLTCLISYAQKTKGKIIVGGSIADLSFQSVNQTFQCSLQPTIGYFIANNFAIGLKPQFGITSIGGSKNFIFVIQPLIRKYFGKSPVRFFIEPTAGLYVAPNSRSAYNWTNGTYQYKGSYNLLLGSAIGFTYFIKDNIGFDFSLSYTHFFVSNYIDSNSNQVVYYNSSVSENVLGSNIGFKVLF